MLVVLAGTVSPWGAARAQGDSGRFGLVNEALMRVPGELASMVRYPFDEPDAFTRYALGVGLLIALDRPLTRAYQRHVETPLRGFELPAPPPLLRDMGFGGPDSWMLMGVAGTYLGGLVRGDARAQRVGIAATKSLAYATLISHLVLKTVAGRKRPLASLDGDADPDGVFTDDPFDFGNPRRPTLRGDADASAFPSFHFTAWFAVARVYQEAYDNAWLPYSLLTLGLASDIQGHRHWVSDMVAGALIGTLIGSAVSRDYFGSDRRLRIGASLRDGEPRLQITYAY